MKRILIISVLLLAVVLSVTADRRRLLLSRNTAATGPTADILWWKLNEGTGTTITGDGTNGGDDGTTDADWTTGASGSGSALLFTRANSDNASTDSAITIATNIFTFTGRFFFTATNLSPAQYLIEHAGIGTESNVVSVALTSAGILDMTMKGVGFTYRNETSLGVVTGAWQHVMIVFDGSANDIKLYIGGSSQSTTVASNSKTSTGNFNTQIIHFGATAGTGGFFNGRGDDYRIYSGDRSADVSTLASETPQ